jgi:hypothetical protein
MRLTSLSFETPRLRAKRYGGFLRMRQKGVSKDTKAS